LCQTVGGPKRVSLFEDSNTEQNLCRRHPLGGLAVFRVKFFAFFIHFGQLRIPFDMIITLRETPL
jgi:hypothetical protein